MQFGSRRAALFALCVGFFASGVASSNGRFPQSQRLLHDPRDPSRLVLASTFGILSSADSGATFHHVCEQAFAKETAEGDPLLEVLPDGRWLAGIASSLNRSSDCGCTWETVAAAADHEFVADLSLTADRKVLLLSYTNDTGVFVHRLSESSDAGSTWQPRAELSGMALALTLDAAPSRPERVYVSGYGRDGAGLLAVSDDRGQNFRYLPIDGASIDAQPYIAAVHPADPDFVFVRTSSLGADSAQSDALLVSRDAGRTFRPLIRQGGALFGFALSPDGASVAIGFGDRLAPALAVDVSALGIYRSPIADTFAFEKVYSASVSCLRWTQQGLFACTAERHPELPSPFALGLARDPSFLLTTPDPFEPVLRNEDVRGPASCLQPSCAEAWTSSTCSRLRASCDLEGAPASLACGGEAPGAGGGRGDPVLDPRDEDDSGGCALAMRPPSASGLATLISAVLALGVALRRTARSAR